MTLYQNLEEIKGLHKKIIEFVENNDVNGTNDEKYNQIFRIKDMKKLELKSMLHMITSLECNHHRTPEFDKKIKDILIQFQSEIRSNFSNFEIFNIFKKSKRILLFLLKAKILIIDQNISCILNSPKYSKLNYPLFFYNELKAISKEINANFIFPDNQIDQIEDLIQKNFELFETKRNIGENDNEICQIIRKDSVNDLLSYIKKSNLKSSSTIKFSIFDTNSFIIKNKPSLIEYSAFFGSIKILKYLLEQQVEITPSLWIYAVHSQNLEVIQLFETLNIFNTNETYHSCLLESIKCHHNDISCYFLDKLQQNQIRNDAVITTSLKYFNLNFIQDDLNNDFYNLCKYDHQIFIANLLNSSNIDININNKMEIKSRNKQEKKTPLHIAVENNNFDIVKLLLQREDIDVNLLSDLKYSYHYKTEIYQKSALHIAVENENVDMVKLLLTHEKIDVNINLTYKYQHSKYFSISTKAALYMAVEKENIEIIKLLLSCKNIDPNIMFISEDHPKKYDIDKAPLHLAVEKNNIEICRLLLSSPKTDVNVRMYDINNNIKTKTGYMFSCVAIHIAVKNGNREIVQLLLSTQKIDLTALLYKKEKVDKYEIHKNKGILHLAVKKNDIEMVKLLLKEKDIDVNQKQEILDTRRVDVLDEYSSLYIAINKEYIEIINLLLARDDIDINDRVVIKERKNVLNEFVEKKMTFLHVAIEKQKIEIINILLKQKNIDVNLKYTAYHYDIDDYDDELGYKEKTTFYLAIEQGNLDIIKILAEHPKIDIKTKSISRKTEFPTSNKSIFEKTALKFAIKHERVDIIDFLLSLKNYDVDAPIVNQAKMVHAIKYKRKTALLLAVERGNTEIVEHLLANPNIDINANLVYENENMFGSYYEEKSALYIAVKNEYLNIVKLLLSHNDININQYSIYKEDMDSEQLIEKNKTPLHIAVEKRNKEIARILLEQTDININANSTYNIQISKKDITISQTKSSLHIAIENEDLEMINLLLNNPKIDINSKLIKKKCKTEVKVLEIGKYVIKQTSYDNLQYKEKNALTMAANMNNIDMVKLLLEKESIDVNAKVIKKVKDYYHKEKTPLIIAIDNENINMAKLLLSQQNIDVNEKFTFIINLNSEVKLEKERKTKAFSELLKDKYQILKEEHREIGNLKKNFRTGLKDYYTSENKKFKKIDEKFEEYKYEYSDEYDISSESREDEYEISYEDSEKIDETEKHKDLSKTPLHIAVQKGNIDIIKMLLSHKEISKNEKDGQGNEPIEMTNNQDIKSLFNSF